MNGRTILKRLNLIKGHSNEFPMKLGCAIAYQDYNNKQLYCHQKNKNGKDMIYSTDYDGNVLRNLTINGRNSPAIAVFDDFFYAQRNEEKTIREINLSTGVVSRKIFLPRAMFKVTDLAIIDTFLYQTGNNAGVNKLYPPSNKHNTATLNLNSGMKIHPLAFHLGINKFMPNYFIYHHS